MTLEPMLRLIGGAFVAASVLAGMYVHPVLSLVHAVRRTEPRPVGVYELVSDDVDSAPFRREGRGWGRLVTSRRSAIMLRGPRSRELTLKAIEDDYDV